MADIKYRFAKAPDGRVVCIDEITSKNRGDFQGLTCFGCGGNISARPGTKVVHHFAHVADGSGCSSESYLHWMTKTRVAEILKRAALAGRAISAHLNT